MSQTNDANEAINDVNNETTHDEIRMSLMPLTH